MFPFAYVKVVIGELAFLPATKYGPLPACNDEAAEKDA